MCGFKGEGFPEEVTKELKGERTSSSGGDGRKCMRGSCVQPGGLATLCQGQGSYSGGGVKVQGQLGGPRGQDLDFELDRVPLISCRRWELHWAVVRKNEVTDMKGLSREKFSKYMTIYSILSHLILLRVPET